MRSNLAFHTGHLSTGSQTTISEKRLKELSETFSSNLLKVLNLSFPAT